MSGKICHPGWLALVFVLFAAQAFGQFEVSPDHFDDAATQTAQKAQHKKTTRRATTAKKAAPGVVAKQKQQPAHAAQQQTKTVAQTQ